MRFGFVDYGRIVEGNKATQSLVCEADVGQRKAWVVAAALEEHSLGTTIVERTFDEHFHPDVARGEPDIALAGFDKA